MYGFDSNKHADVVEFTRAMRALVMDGSNIIGRKSKTIEVSIVTVNKILQSGLAKNILLQ